MSWCPRIFKSSFIKADNNENLSQCSNINRKRSAFVSLAFVSSNHDLFTSFSSTRRSALLTSLMNAFLMKGMFEAPSLRLITDWTLGKESNRILSSELVRFHLLTAAISDITTINFYSYLSSVLWKSFIPTFFFHYFPFSSSDSIINFFLLYEFLSSIYFRSKKRCERREKEIICLVRNHNHKSQF